jgi:hypothetical protein
MPDAETPNQVAAPDKPARCEDYDNDPRVHYHALELPRCANVSAVVTPEGRWVCNTHEWLRQTRKALALVMESQPSPEEIVRRWQAGDL